MNKITALQTASLSLDTAWNTNGSLSGHYDDNGRPTQPNFGIIEHTFVRCIDAAYREHADPEDALQQVIKDLRAYVNEIGAVIEGFEQLEPLGA